MTDIDFTYFYKQKYSNVAEIEHCNYEILISTFNHTDRVCKIFEAINANEKYLIVLPEYEDDLFTHFINASNVNIPYEGYIQLSEFLDTLQINENTKLCIDLTGFIIPHILFMIRYLQKKKKVNHIDIFYTEPQKYTDEENTHFSDFFHEVSLISGYAPTANPNMDNDLLIIASGYDDSRITDVASKRKNANKIQLFGFPPMQADMFQENMLKAYKAEGAVGGDGFKNLELNLYAPANDPFVAAQIIKKYIDREQRNKLFSNIYLAPVSTKPHALGMALYCLWENPKEDKPISIIYPVCKRYYGDTSEGVAKIWKYSIELPILP
ncbi:MAG: hypothetical protein LBO74_08265 [Candidatus Symbiothrix sp.]|jgi:hypothetical protein|nr:hypothetical protein [Candidatus Symbiothrix sp.]